MEWKTVPLHETIALYLLCCLQAFGAVQTYYIDYTGGSDANNGTATNAAWKHHPFMTNTWTEVTVMWPGIDSFSRVGKVGTIQIFRWLFQWVGPQIARTTTGLIKLGTREVHGSGRSLIWMGRRSQMDPTASSDSVGDLSLIGLLLIFAHYQLLLE